MESLSNPHRNPQDKNISHFMDEETATEKNDFPSISQRIHDIRIRAPCSIPGASNAQNSLISAHKICFLDELIARKRP